MIRLNLAWWCWITSTIDYIKSIKAGDPFPEVAAKLPRESVARIWLSYQEDAVIRLRASTGAAGYLLELVSKLIIENPDRAEPITAEEAEQLQKAATDYKTLFENELSMVDAYAVKQKGIYSTEKLVDHAEEVLSAEVRQALDRDALSDLQSAGRCLAFELPTAAGFHVARATEAAMLLLMNAAQCTPTKKSQRNWGKYIDTLEKANVPATITHHLTQIKVLHRNPIGASRSNAFDGRRTGSLGGLHQHHCGHGW